MGHTVRFAAVTLAVLTLTACQGNSVAPSTSSGRATKTPHPTGTGGTSPSAGVSPTSGWPLTTRAAQTAVDGRDYPALYTVDPHGKSGARVGVLTIRDEGGAVLFNSPSPGPGEFLTQSQVGILMAIGSLVRQTAMLDQSFALAISALTGVRYEKAGRVPSGTVRAAAEHAWKEHSHRVPEPARSWFDRQLDESRSFITRRNRIMHDLTLTATPGTAARIEYQQDGSVAHVPESAEQLMLLARVAKCRAAFTNTLFLEGGDLTAWRAAVESWAEQLGAAPADGSAEPWHVLQYRSLL